MNKQKQTKLFIMNTENLLNGLSSEFTNIDKVKEKIFTPQLVQLHPNIEGFNIILTLFK